MKKSIVIILLIIVCLVLFYKFGRSIWHPVSLKIIGKQTVSQVISIYGQNTQKELSPLFTKAGIQYPPNKVALIAFKDTAKLELWASGDGSNYTHITTYPIKAASGKLGPKLREGDYQVPEGIYKITGFNPNSSYHLSMKLNYPNLFDLKHAKAEGRSEPGTNIFIHGRAVSIGCLAMGDPVIEKLFSLVHATGRANTLVLISPTDPSVNNLAAPADAPKWTNELYKIITEQYLIITKKRQQGGLYGD